VVWLYGNILPDLGVVDGLENSKAVAHTAHTDLLELGVL
jgi:hypothetical protein